MTTIARRTMLALKSSWSRPRCRSASSFQGTSRTGRTSQAVVDRPLNYARPSLPVANTTMTTSADVGQIRVSRVQQNGSPRWRIPHAHLSRRWWCWSCRGQGIDRMVDSAGEQGTSATACSSNGQNHPAKATPTASRRKDQGICGAAREPLTMALFSGVTKLPESQRAPKEAIPA